jgi:thiol-disulfide isomerase/thioredoxin
VRRSSLIKISLLGLCTIGIFLLSHCTEEKKTSRGFAPDFTLKAFDGREIALSRLRGKVVLLDFWATWCAPCREYIPHLIQLHKNYRERGFELVGMNVDRGDIEVVRRYIKSMDIPYSVITTPEEVLRAYRVTGIPVTFLIDKEGKIRERITGFNPTIAKELTAKVEALTSEKP